MTAHVPFVYVVDEDAEARDYICSLVATIGLHARVYSDVAAFLEHLSGDEPACLVYNVHAQSTSVAALHAEFVRRNARLPVIVTAAREDLSFALQALKSGAVEVLEKPLAANRLLSCVLRALTSDLYTRMQRSESEDVRVRYLQLSPREREVLHKVVAGATSGDIAAQLGIREKTVEVYRSHINKKMRCRNAVELARLIQSLDPLPPPPLPGPDTTDAREGLAGLPAPRTPPSTRSMRPR